VRLGAEKIAEKLHLMYVLVRDDCGTHGALG
jgi:hypothetical protein